MKTFIYKNTFVAIVSIGISLFSCKKDEIVAPKAPIITTPTTDTVADVRDSVYYFATEHYLWNTVLPNLKTFKANTPTPEDVLAHVRTYSPLGSQGTNIDRWSFAIKRTDWDNFAAGKSTDYGCTFRFASTTDLRIGGVYANSSAGKQGVQRGWQILSFNGIIPTTNNVNVLSAELNTGNPLKMIFAKPDGTQQTITISTDAYQTNPILAKSIMKVGVNNVGYMAFNQFLGTTAEQDINDTFTYFKSNNISELIVDLRYNGGGYGSLAELMANLIAPKVVSGKIMYKDVHNAKYTSWDRTHTFATTSPANALDLKRVFFITTRSSASASELLINSLTPYLDVKLIGNTTNGKPAGYYNFPAMNYYSFPLAIKTQNAMGYGDYFDGLPVTKFQIDDLTRNWGDVEELCTKEALNYIHTGKFTSSITQNAHMEALESYNDALDHSFKGLIMIRK